METAFFAVIDTSAPVSDGVPAFFEKAYPFACAVTMYFVPDSTSTGSIVAVPPG